MPEKSAFLVTWSNGVGEIEVQASTPEDLERMTNAVVYMAEGFAFKFNLVTVLVLFYLDGQKQGTFTVENPRYDDIPF